MTPYPRGVTPYPRGVQCQLGAVKQHVVGQMLEKVAFFKSVSKPCQLALGGIMDIVYFQPGQTIFSEGDEGDKFYVLVDGTVNMFKVRPLPHVVAARPWFYGCQPLGHPGMMNRTPRVITRSPHSPPSSLAHHHSPPSSTTPTRVPPPVRSRKPMV